MGSPWSGGQWVVRGAGSVGSPWSCGQWVVRGAGVSG